MEETNVDLTPLNAVEEYIEIQKKWRDASVYSDAFKQSEMNERKKHLVVIMSRHGGLDDPALAEYSEELASDVAALHPPKVREIQYANVLQRQAKLREAFMSEELKVGALNYREGISKISQTISERTGVRFEHDLLDIRKEVVSQHFNDPRFLFEIGATDSDLVDDQERVYKSLRDEVLHDLDRGDLKDANRSHATRSNILASKFSDAARSIDRTNPSVALEGFLRLRGMRTELLADQAATMEVAKDLKGLRLRGLERAQTVKDDAAYNLAISALDDRGIDRSLLEGYYETLPGLKRQAIKFQSERNIAKAFYHARQKFDEDVLAGRDPTLSFTVMFQTGRKISALSDDVIRRAVSIGSSPEDRARNLHAFSMIKREYDSEIGRSPDDTPLSRVGAIEIEEATREEVVNLYTDSEKVNKFVGHERGELNSHLIAPTKTPIITVLTGAHIQMSYRNAGFAETVDYQRLLEASGDVSDRIDLSNVEAMSAFLSENHANVINRFGSARNELTRGSFEDPVAGALFERIITRRMHSDGEGQIVERGGASKADRIEFAFRMGQGESVLKAYGVDESLYADVASGKLAPADISNKLSKAGLTDDLLMRIYPEGKKALLLDPQSLIDLAEKADEKGAREAFRNILSNSHSLRIEGIVAPPLGQRTTDGSVDAGEASKLELQSMLNKYGLQDGPGELSFEVKRSKDDRENVVNIKLLDGRDLSDILLHKGYAVPLTGEAGTRQEQLAKVAENNRRGLWKGGMPGDIHSWRREAAIPELHASDIRENLEATVAASMAGSPSHARRILEMKETKLFAIPASRFAMLTRKNTDMKISPWVRDNKYKANTIYDNNMKVLTELRDKNAKGNLSNREKSVHDYLTLGTRALGAALVREEVITREKYVKDDAKLLSRNGMLLSKEFLNEAKDLAQDTASGAVKTSMKTGKAYLSGLKAMSDAVIS